MKDSKLIKKETSGSPENSKKSNSQRNTPRGSTIYKGRTWEKEYNASKSTLKKVVETPSSLIGGDPNTITVGSKSFQKT